jgi:hypothetical protein
MMKNRYMGILFCAIAIGLVAATYANAGLTLLYPTPNDLPNLTNLPMLHSTPNDLPGLLRTKHFTLVLVPNEKIIDAALTFINILDWTKESDEHIFINHGISDNLAVHSTLVNNLSASLSDKPQHFDTVIDFGKLGLLDTLNAYAKTAGTGQANFEFRIDPDCNDYHDDVTPAIITEPRPSWHTIPDR